jgi:hypothetical protein
VVLHTLDQEVRVETVVAEQVELAIQQMELQELQTLAEVVVLAEVMESLEHLVVLE